MPGRSRPPPRGPLRKDLPSAALAAPSKASQQALKRAGYDPGPIDGLVGRQTVEAIHSFQKDNGREVGDLNASTLKALKVPMDKLPKL